MLSTTKNFPSLRLLIATGLTVLFCAGAAFAIVGWTPGGSGIPADLAAIQQQE